MKSKITAQLLIILVVLLIAVPVIGTGCQEEKKLPAEIYTTPFPSELSSTLVPNVPLDVYVYARQDNPTKIPSDMVDLPHEVEVDRFSLWGVPAGDEFAFGMGITLTNADDASQLYGEINLKGDVWKMLSGDTIYLVVGLGTAAESLKTAISNRDFKYFDNSEFLEAAATLPANGITKPVAIGIGKPSKALINFIAKDVVSEALEQIEMALNLAKLNVIAFGLYSPYQIDVAEVTSIVESGGNVSSLDIGAVVYAKSGLPGFLAGPAISQFLKEAHFAEDNLGGLTVYRRVWDAGADVEIPVLITIDGNRISAAIAVQESYAETLITSINNYQ